MSPVASTAVPVLANHTPGTLPAIITRQLPWMFRALLLTLTVTRLSWRATRPTKSIKRPYRLTAALATHTARMSTMAAFATVTTLSSRCGSRRLIRLNPNQNRSMVAVTPILSLKPRPRFQDLATGQQCPPPPPAMVIRN